MNLKKAGAFLVSVLMILTAANAVPRDARAVVGATGVGSSLLYAGFVITALGSVGLMADALEDAAPQDAFKATLGTGVLTWFVGLLLLDANQGTGATFAPVSDADGLKAGLTSAEVDAFNQNIEELNAVTQATGAESAAARDFSREGVSARFDRYGSELPADAVSAAKKIAAYAVQQAHASR